jgi:hypothetical protein
MGHSIYVGWWGKVTLSHCNGLDGWSLCKTQNPPHYLLGSDYHNYGWTRQDVQGRGWKLCPSCNSRKNQEEIESIESAIKAHRQQTEDK